MIVTGARKKKNVRYATFGCSTVKTKGGALCKNKLMISERKAKDQVLSALRSLVTNTLHTKAFIERFNKSVRSGEKQAERDAAMVALDKQIAQSERALSNVTEALSHAGWSEALGVRLKEEETRLQALKARKAAAEGPRNVVVLPNAKTVAQYVKKLLVLLEGDVERARDLLAAHCGQWRLTVENTEGPGRPFYRAHGAFDLSFALGEPEQVLEKQSCGGRI